jgi:hypothetical protein
MSKCPKCGIGEITTDSKFCPNCGTAIVIMQAPPAAPQPQVVPPQPQAVPPPTPVVQTPMVPPQPQAVPPPTPIVQTPVVPPQPQAVVHSPVVHPQVIPQAVPQSSRSSKGVKPLSTERHFEDVSKHEKPKGRSIVSRIMLAICALVGLYAFLIPFFEIFVKGHKTLISGLDVVQAGLNKTGFWNYGGGEKVVSYITEMLSSFHGPEKIFKLGGILLVTAGPAIFGLMFLMYLLSALRGRRYTSGFTFSIVYTVMSGVIFFVAGMEIGVKIIIFEHLASGYWITIIALFGAKMSSRIH